MVPMLKPGIIVVMDILGEQGGEAEELNEPQSNLVSGIFVTVNLHAPPRDIVVASWP